MSMTHSVRSPASAYAKGESEWGDQALAHSDWAFLAASILALPVVGTIRGFRWVAILTGLVLLECGVLAVNGGRCPLSDLAAGFTDDRAHNFDIYLPNWLAERNKVVFGVLFVAGEMVVLGYWLGDRRCASSRQGNTASSEGRQQH